MKVTVNVVETKDEEVKFPVLMKSTNSDLVVLFWLEHSGIVVNAHADWDVGETCDDFAPASDPIRWNKFEGTITLEND